MLGLTRGTRHYIQYTLTDDAPGEDWRDLLFVNDEGQPKGLWCSRSYSRANARIEELMTECDTTRDQYRIVRRTWDETILEHNPNYGQSAITESDEDEDNDEDGQDPTDGEYTDEDADAEADLEAQVGEVPDTGNDDPEPPVNTPVANPLVK